MLFILLLANMTAEYRLLAEISEVFFYSILAISTFVIILNLKTLALSLRNVAEIKWLIFVYIIAMLFFQFSFLSSDIILYTITKVIVFGTITLSICYNYDFYLRKAPVIFSYIILILIALGWFVNKTGEYDVPVFGFANRNVACTIATAGVAGFLFMRDRIRPSDFLFMAVLIITILYGGSRNAFAMCILIIIIRYGFSFKIVVAGALILVLVTFLLPEFGMEANAYDRLVGTIDGSVSTDREEVREIAKKMIAMRPWTGWGYNYSVPKYLGINLGAHNGYLATIVNLGYPCGLMVLAIIVIGSIKRLRLYKIGNKAINYYIAILISTLFAANQESYLIGVNQFTTNYFFVAFVVLGAYRYKYQGAAKNKDKYDNAKLYCN